MRSSKRGSTVRRAITHTSSCRGVVILGECSGVDRSIVVGERTYVCCMRRSEGRRWWTRARRCCGTYWGHAQVARCTRARSLLATSRQNRPSHWGKAQATVGDRPYGRRVFTGGLNRKNKLEASFGFAIQGCSRDMCDFALRRRQNLNTTHRHECRGSAFFSRAALVLSLACCCSLPVRLTLDRRFAMRFESIDAKPG